MKSKELLDCSIDDTEERLSDEGLKNSSAKYYPAHSVLIAMYGANVGQLGWLRMPATVNQAVCGLVVDDSKADWRFVFYSLLHTRGDLTIQAQGAAQQNLNQDLIRQFEIQLPTLPVQRRIARILSAYDELIENSQRRIKILEAMARALYREWFVHFRFPGHENHPRVASPLGEIPEGWEMKRLDRLAEIKGGKQLEKENIHETGEFPVFGGNGIQGYSEKATHRDFVIAFGRVGAYCGAIHWSYGGAWLNNNSSSVVPVRHNELVLHHLLEFNFTNLRGGAAQPFISNSALASIELVFPGDTLAEKFCSLVEPLRLQQVTLERSVHNLRRTRDLLLPRLLSGQLEVEAA